MKGYSESIIASRNLELILEARPRSQNPWYRSILAPGPTGLFSRTAIKRFWLTSTDIFLGILAWSQMTLGKTLLQRTQKPMVSQLAKGFVAIVILINFGIQTSFEAAARFTQTSDLLS